MTHTTFGLVILAFSFVASIGWLVLQLGALGRYRHVSFLILSLATTCALVGFFFGVVPYWWDPFGASAITLRVLWGASVVLQSVLGLWGTLWLYRSYGQLAAAKGGASGADQMRHQMTPSTLILGASLVVLSFALVAAAYQIDRQAHLLPRDASGVAWVQASLAFAHYKEYGTIAYELENKCYDAALTNARELKNAQIFILAENLRRTGNDASLLAYIKLRDPELLKSVLAGHVPELRPYRTWCPGEH